MLANVPSSRIAQRGDITKVPPFADHTCVNRRATEAQASAVCMRFRLAARASRCDGENVAPMPKKTGAQNCSFVSFFWYFQTADH